MSVNHLWTAFDWWASPIYCVIPISKTPSLQFWEEFHYKFYDHYNANIIETPIASPWMKTNVIIKWSLIKRDLYEINLPVPTRQWQSSYYSFLYKKSIEEKPRVALLNLHSWSNTMNLTEYRWITLSWSFCPWDNVSESPLNGIWLRWKPCREWN